MKHATPRDAARRRERHERFASYLPADDEPATLSTIRDYADAHAKAYHVAKDTPGSETIAWERAWRDVAAAKSRLVEEVQRYAAHVAGNAPW